MHDLGRIQRMSCHWSDEFQKIRTEPTEFFFQKNQDFFSENHAPGFLGNLAAIQAL